MSDDNLLNQPPVEAPYVDPMDPVEPPQKAADAMAAFLDSGDTKQDKLSAEIESLEQLKSLEDMTPPSQYLRRLDNAKIALGEARAIVDTMCVQLRPFRKTYTVFKTKEVVFQTRTPEMKQAIDLALERSSFTLHAALSTYQAKLHMAYSVCRFGDQDFFNKEMNTNYPDKVMAYIDKIPEPVFNLLWKHLREFEGLVSLAVSDGFEENF